MGTHTVKLPDVGEGVAEAELTEWNVEVGTIVQEDDILATVMTDKAAVEIPSPVSGTVQSLGGQVGEVLSVGAPLVTLEVDGDGNTAPEPDAKEAAPEPDEPEGEDEEETQPKPAPEKKAEKPEPKKPSKPAQPAKPAPVATGGPARGEHDRPVAAPSVRRRAKEGGVDLRQVRGTGPAGRITHEDLDLWFSGSGEARSGGGRVANTAVEEIKVVGLRRRIAARMAEANAHVAHITYVDEIDMTELERLRETLNKEHAGERPKLTLLPFLMRAMVNAIAKQPALNAHYDDDAGVIHQYGGVHIGIATQAPGGLMVPVVRHVEARGLWDSAAEVTRLAEAARTGSASRDELSGSTITITSLGAMGGIATTPIINRPEVAIIGVNKMQMRPVWDGTQFVPRKMMNLSSSFDHRVVDGWDAAVFVQAIRRQLENPATLFVED
ncbi:dihydrolipoamide acetyltransferase family protein [Thalassobaculum salexigens]|uniref:dihydrolipoamide acetyltransferase family protein n=1 Tax=Thalassobaculum salexigens TaxID=455360 RepID=UPI0004124DA5|nr:dihydrolipoamide acetyltransferase family protein [Thalassobaculum salexigens]